jgi:hypothetical protein
MAESPELQRGYRQKKVPSSTVSTATQVQKRSLPVIVAGVLFSKTIRDD